MILKVPKIAMTWAHNGLEYKVVDGKVKDVWTILDLTDEEKKKSKIE